MVLKEVPSGTPNRLAMVIPAIMMETASELLPFIGKPFRNDRTDPEIGSVRESGDEAGDKQHPVVR